MKFGRTFFFAAAYLFSTIGHSLALLPGLYCGTENCYDVLGVARDATKAQIAKAYRKLAAQHHPDKAKGAEAKKEAVTKFQTVAVAYETLKDEDARKDYDYMLDNPEELYRHYWYYYKRKAPKVDVRLVIIATILIISIVQYVSAWQNYNETIGYYITVPKYRLNAIEIAKERGTWTGGTKPKRKERLSKEEQKQEEENVIRGIIQEKMGAKRRPSLINTLLAQILIFPYTLVLYIRWYADWIWRFTIKKQPYEDEQKLYLIRRHMKLSQSQFDYLADEATQESYLDDELWIKSKFDVWQAKKVEEEKAKLAESGRYKQYRRYMRNHGPGQISFLDDD